MTQLIETPQYTLYQGDCLDYMRGMQAGSVDAVVTDPPYSEKTKIGARTRNDNLFSGDRFIDFSITDNELMERFDCIGLICKRWTIATVDFIHGAKLSEQPPKNMKFIRAGVWIKTNSAPQFTGDRPAPGWEFIALMHNKNNQLSWNRGGSRAVWQTSIENNNGHPTPKPIQLMTKFINDFTSENDIVFDPFMGSGTTGVACAQLGRRFVGCEIDPGYFEIARKRIETAYRQTLLPLDLG